jgi:putative glutathione S-transferase
MWTSKLMVDGVWRGDIVPAPDVQAGIAADANAFRARSPLGHEPGRYHLYVSYACPFAHRAILGRLLRGLEGLVGMSVLHPRWNTAQGWSFGSGPMSTPDHVNGCAHLHEIYTLSKPDYTGTRDGPGAVG